jgi:hypothetical protein
MDKIGNGSAKEKNTTLSPAALKEIAQVEAEIDRTRGTDTRAGGYATQ